MNRAAPAFAIVMSLFAAPAFGQDAVGRQPAAPSTPAPAPVPYKISGLVFGDYYAFPAHHLPAWDGQHGFWLRRVYVTYDHTFSPALSARVRLEMNSNGKLAGGALTPFLKDAYLRWTFHGRQALTLGIQPTLTFEFVESVWGLRHIEKTPLDLYRWDSSRDAGVTFSGPLDDAGTVRYGVQYGNESGSNAETDRHKGVRAAARYAPKQGLTAEVMLARFSRANDRDRTTAQIFGGWRGARARAGAQYAFQKRRGLLADTDLNLLSGFAVVDLKPGALSAFARVDRYADPCPDCAAIDYLPIATTHPFTMTLAGLEYSLHPSVRISPNVEWIAYGDNGALPKPAHDTVARLTFYWNF